MGRAALVEDFAGAVAEHERGRARFVRDNLNVMPRDATAPAGAERLQRGLFGGEAGSVMLRRRRASGIAVDALIFGEDALAEAWCAPQHFTDARNFDNVDADGNNHK